MAITQDSTHPTGVSDDSPNGSSAAIRARERKAFAALELKKLGETWDTIAETLGFPTARAALVATEKVLADGALSPESQEFMRQLCGARLEELIYSLRAKALDDEHPDQLGAVREVRGLLETHMKLMGYARPTEVAIYNPMESEINEFVAQFIRARESGRELEESDIFGDDVPGDGEEPPAYEITSVPAKPVLTSREQALQELAEF